ncbi:MAG: type II toxin-antitoxin system RelE/ParE family toxin [Gemmataceae bacterium]
MSLPVVLRPLASADVRQIHADLEARSAGLGDKFLDRLQEALDRIEAMPEMYAEVWGAVRAARLHKFRHVV